MGKVAEATLNVKDDWVEVSYRVGHIPATATSDPHHADSDPRHENKDAKARILCISRELDEDEDFVCSAGIRALDVKGCSYPLIFTFISLVSKIKRVFSVYLNKISFSY